MNNPRLSRCGRLVTIEEIKKQTAHWGVRRLVNVCKLNSGSTNPGESMSKSSIKAALSQCGRWVLATGGAPAIALALGLVPSHGGSLIYTPYNPSFGGNPNNGPVLKGLADAQNLPLANQNAAQAAANAARGVGGTAALTPSQIFAQQLQSQLLSSFSNQITQAIFGPNAAKSHTGTFTFGSTTISFAPDPQNAALLNISIFDGVSTTNIQVPITP